MPFGELKLQVGGDLMLHTSQLSVVVSTVDKIWHSFAPDLALSKGFFLMLMGTYCHFTD